MGHRRRRVRAAWLLVFLTLAGPSWSHAQTPAKGRADGGPTVRSRAAADLLKPPTSDPYGSGEIDWRDVPPWRQTSFFGIRAKGQLFIYVVDCSGSMIDEDRLFRTIVRR